MRLTHCQATDFMGFATLDMDLDHDMVVILGDNGAGKSSAIKAMKVAIGAWMLGIPEETPPLIERWMIRYELNSNDNDLNKTYSDRAELQGTVVGGTAKFGATGEKRTWSRSRGLEKGSRTNRRNANSIRDYASEARKLQKKLPLLAYYGARRSVPHPIKPERSGPQPRMQAYEGTLNSSIDFNGRFGRWHRLKYQALDKPAAKLVYDALVGTLTALLPGVSRVDYDADFEEPVVYFDSDVAGGGIRAFSSLSDGYQQLLGIGLDLALRAIQLNPQLGDQVLKQTTGVVLIDEVDQHLHPIWQRSITQGLRAAFPSLQFILTTHSPLVAMGAAEHATVIRLRAGEDGPITETLNPIALGPSVDEVLRGEAFGVATTWSPEVLRLTADRLNLLTTQRAEPDGPNLAAALTKNRDDLRRLRRPPITHIEDLIRVTVDDMLGDATTLSTEQAENLRQRLLARLRKAEAP